MTNLNNWVLSKKGAMKWAEATKEIKGRSGKQIRERWFNILNPHINKAKWTTEEERLLFQLYQDFGPKWCSLVEHFENRTENSIKNRFYSTLRRVATEHKRRVEKDSKNKKTKNLKSQQINKINYPEETKGGIDDELYLENPQIAKTEDLLKFLPMVAVSLGVENTDSPKITESKPNANKKKQKRSLKPNIVRKRKNNKPKIQVEANRILKQPKITEENLEEEKETRPEKAPFSSQMLSVDKVDSKMTPVGEPEMLSRTPLESLDPDLIQVVKNVPEAHNLSKSCMSIKSNDHLIEHFPEDPFHHLYYAGPTKHTEMKVGNSKFMQNHSYDFSDNDYSEDCKFLEDQLLNECDLVIEDIGKELH